MTQTTISRPGFRWRVLAAAATITLGVTVAVVAQHVDDSPAPARANAPSMAVHVAPEEVSAYARSHDLTGLSPASLTRRDRATAASPEGAVIAETYRNVARYAQAHGLAGLSPASVAPVAQRTTGRAEPPTRE
jgi:hypothetical protein